MRKILSALVFAAVLGCAVFAAAQGLSSGPGLMQSQLNAQVQAGIATTTVGGSWTFRFSQPYGAAPAVNPIPINTAGGQPIICNVESVSATSVSGGCWQNSTTTISLAIVQSGINVNPDQPTPAGVSVQIIARNMTQ